MDPREWLEQNYPAPEDDRRKRAYALDEFARDVGKPYLWLYRQIEGLRTVGVELMEIFHERSHGKVTLEDWIALAREYGRLKLRRNHGKGTGRRGDRQA